MWSRFASPIGPRASSSVRSTPNSSKVRTNASTGARLPKSTVVPAQSKITARTWPSRPFIDVPFLLPPLRPQFRRYVLSRTTSVLRRRDGGAIGRHDLRLEREHVAARGIDEHLDPVHI